MATQIENEVREQLQKIRSTAPSACELEDCHDLQASVQKLLDFAWRAVNPPKDERIDDLQAEIERLRGLLDRIQYLEASSHMKEARRIAAEAMHQTDTG